MTTNILEIQLLGPIEISYGNAPVRINRRIERTILYILAVEHRPVSRTTLIDMLWPEANQMDPRGALRTALSRLRNELPNSDLICSKLDQVWLHNDLCNIDLVHFESSYLSLQNTVRIYPDNQGLPVQIVNQIRQSLALWHGDSILMGENFSDYPEINLWRQSHNQALTHQRKFLLRRLGEHFQTIGQPDLALEYFIQLGQSEIFDIESHLKVFNILMNLGRYQQAVRYCDDLEDAYAHKFNTPLPEPIIKECQAAHFQLKNSKNQQERGSPFPLTMQLPLVGRQSELNQLQQAFYRGGIVTIKGELGSGKTRLVQEFYQMLAPNTLFFLAPSQKMENALPFSPIIHALRRFVPESIWRDIDNTWANQLSLILPELTEIREDCNPPTISNLPSGTQHLFDALDHLFNLIVGNHRRLVFFLDDAQWADKQTLQALSYLIFQGFFKRNNMLIIASRPEESNPEMEEMINHFYRTHAIQNINLSGLNPKELRTLAEQAFRNQVPVAFIDKLYQETNGNPFISLEIIRSILDKTGDIESFNEMPHLPLPESVHALIRQRLNRLDETSRHILLCAAVIGNTFPFSLLQSVSGLVHIPDPTVIDPLMKDGFINFIHKNEESLDQFQFAHEKIREVVLKEATPMSLKILNRRVAVSLAAKPQSQSKAAVIANHYLAGGDILQAFYWYLEAAEHNWTLGAKEDVLKAYQKAEQLLQNSGEGLFNNTDILQLYSKWSEFAYQSNQVDLLEEVGLKLQFLGERENNPLLIGVSQVALSNACFLRLKLDPGIEKVNKAIENLKLTENKIALAQAYLRLGTFQWWKLHFNGTISAGKKVLELGKTIESNLPEKISLMFNAKHSINMAYYAKGDAIKALQSAQNIHNQYFQLLTAYDKIRTLNMLAHTHMLAANFEECAYFAKMGLDIAKALDNSFIQEVMLIIQAKTELLQGCLDEAYFHTMKALKLAESSNNLHTIIDANCILGDIYFYLQNYTNALHHYRIGEIREGFKITTFQGIENYIHLARTLNVIKQTNEAQQVLEKVFTITKDSEMRKLYIDTLIVGGYFNWEKNDYSSADQKFNQALEIATEKGLKHEVIRAQKGLARVKLSTQQFDDAEQIIHDLIHRSQKLNAVWLTMNGLKMLAELKDATQQDPISLDNSPMLDEILTHLEQHTQAAPLKQDYDIAKKYWKKGQFSF